MRCIRHPVLVTALLVWSCLFTTSAQAQTLLETVLATAGPGTVIALPGGDYGALVLKDGGGAAGNPLVIKAADPAKPPRFTQLDLNGTHHIVLDGLVFDYTFAAGDPIYAQLAMVRNAQDVMIRNTLFDGDVAQGLGAADDGFGYGIALTVAGSADFTLQTSEIRSFHRGLGISESRNVTVRGNDIHDLRSDGMNFAQVSNVLIEGNYLHDFRTSETSDDHADMIQFWTVQTTAPSQRITIRDNVLNSGKGAWTQSIFMRNELVDQKQAGPEMFYRDITVTGNVIINAFIHGITVGEVDGLIIANNTLLQNIASKGPENNPSLYTPQILVSKAALNVQLVRNVAAKVDPAPRMSRWLVSKNYAVQNQARQLAGFYDLVFANPALGDPRDLASFAYRPDGVLAGAGLGAARLDTAHPAIKAGPYTSN